ncbi:outer membrane protein precursor, OmpA family [Flavobacterium limnosediminis JC2902]|uniref:Outer membrane protein, OmpA family n=1 Tax=Flavobacterium limnosediminis JC2902 TaxID=1341181 RepID=V6SQ90_9FLAO|nr:OmpA family protein [Flavobacterium limnosediminis]ESU28848.1 outer membrane protein precursor, OmpA family [Flavobacterium limnosediminis JC2902]
MKRFSVFLLLVFPFFMSAQEQFSVYFESNKHELTKKQSALLSEWMIANKDSKVVAINGFTDEDGSNVHNDSLSQRRVDFIQTVIVKNSIKIRDDFKTRSFGESHDHSNIKAENRKAVIYYIKAKDLARENEILGIKPAQPVVAEIVPIEEEDMHFPPNATLEEKVALARPGTRIVIKDVFFYKNTFGIMPTSKRAMDELLMVLDRNPKMVIEIQGHICCVDADKRNLSLDRAKQVRRVLEANGISPKRLKVKGFGVSHPKFPIPEANELEALANRRVEIMILSK